jgi:HEAT repeat protein
VPAQRDRHLPARCAGVFTGVQRELGVDGHRVASIHDEKDARPTPTSSTVAVVSERDLVQMLATAETRLDAMRALAGGITATELRAARVSDAAAQALIEGVADPNPKVRWWCIQLLDHLPDERAIAPLSDALHDPVPRVRRNAAHALGCIACKPTMTDPLPGATLETLARIAVHDPNAKVRAEAALALHCRG